MGLCAVVLCGGRSTRMGRSKAWLRVGGEPLLRRVIERVRPAVDAVVVVAAPDQELPELANVTVARDPIEGHGPLQGLAIGLRAATREHAFVCSTDLPFICPELVRRLHRIAIEGGHPIVVPCVAGQRHPLAAVYRTELAELASTMLLAGERRLMALLDRAGTRAVDESELLADDALRAADPELRSLLDVDTPEEYEAALASSSSTGKV